MTTHARAERHFSTRSAWLRAAVLGANDGLISTASLIVGVVAAGGTRSSTLIAGVAGLTAGAFSMAAGEYVSVSSQRDAEHADIERERAELATASEAEHEELVGLYIDRGLSEGLARQVADELSRGDRLVVHARDELGLDLGQLANPVQASFVSAMSFAVGAVLPLLVILVSGNAPAVELVMAITLVGLVLLGALGARLGGAPWKRAAVRVFVGGLLALFASLGIGHLTGSVL
jgi:VIT1/CCC1 family predicted Fe2+/Mn2+ transporter